MNNSLKYLLPLALVSLSACDPIYRESITTHDIPKSNSNGYVAIAFTQQAKNCDPNEPFAQATKYFVSKKNENSKYSVAGLLNIAPPEGKSLNEAGRVLVEGNEFKRSDFRDVTGKLILVELAAGDYYFDGPAAIGSYTYATDIHGVTISVEPQKVTYIGSFNMQLTCAAALIGERVVSGAGNIQDRRDRDMAVLKSKFPHFAEMPVKYNVSELTSFNMYRVYPY